MDNVAASVPAPRVAGVMAPILAAIDPAQRPRERLLRLGPDALSDAELVALLLGSGRRGVNAVELARDLLTTHGGLDGLSRSDGEVLQATTGVGPAKATRVVAALALARRFGTSTDRRASIRAPGDVVRLLEPLLAGPGGDQVAAVVCDRANRALATVLVGPHGPRFPVREVLAETLRRDGVAVAVGHRRPAPDPGVTEDLDRADRRSTDALVAAAAQCGVRVLDHVVTDGATWRSLLEPPARPRQARTPAVGRGSAR